MPRRRRGTATVTQRFGKRGIIIGLLCNAYHMTALQIAGLRVEDVTEDTRTRTIGSVVRVQAGPHPGWFFRLRNCDRKLLWDYTFGAEGRPYRDRRPANTTTNALFPRRSSFVAPRDSDSHRTDDDDASSSDSAADNQGVPVGGISRQRVEQILTAVAAMFEDEATTSTETPVVPCYDDRTRPSRSPPTQRKRARIDTNQNRTEVYRE
jgi:hypothetical protein